MLRFIAGIIAGALIAAPLTAVAVDPVPTVELEPGQEVVVRAKPQATPTLVPTPSPTVQPTVQPTPAPTAEPTPEPTPAPIPTSLWLVDPATDQRIRQLNEPDTVNNPFALEVVTTSTGSVRTTFDADPVRNENNPPFAPCGDQSGDFAACGWTSGSHTLRIQVYSADNGGGTLLVDELIDLTVGGTSGGTGPSGIAVSPVKAGWQRVGFSDFTANIPFGSWTGDPEGALMGRASGTDTSGNGTYSLAEISQHDGVLDCRMRKVNGQFVMGTPMNKAPNPSNNSATAPFSIRVTSAMRVEAPAPDFKIAHMVAKYGTVRQQEIDWPEVRLRDGATASAWLHLLDGGSGKHFPTNASIYEWHTYTTEFVSGQSVRVYLDGVQIGSNTNASLIGTDRVHWIIQNETAIGVELTDGRQAHVLIDWVTIDIPA